MLTDERQQVVEAGRNVRQLIHDTGVYRHRATPSAAQIRTENRSTTGLPLSRRLRIPYKRSGGVRSVLTSKQRPSPSALDCRRKLAERLLPS